jgi:hypothetical protein
MSGSGLPCVALAASLALAACQPLPHPFAGDAPPPGASILAMPGNASVAVAPITGEPWMTAEKLAPAMARALQQHDIAASDTTASVGGYQLNGTLTPMTASPGKSAVMVMWELRDPSGYPVGERMYAMEAQGRDWKEGEDGAVERLAAASAAQVSPLLVQEAPVEADIAGRTRVFVAGINGAPGDGRQSLTTAITSLLKRQGGVVVADDKTKSDLLLDAEVKVATAEAGKQKVKIVWHVRRADGSEIGQVGQENDVPKGLLDVAWGDVAYMVAVSAEDGIMQLVERGAAQASEKPAKAGG